MKKVHYPNLNFLRFIAASAVIIHHVEQVKFIFGFKNDWANPIIPLIGKLGVDLFFVLSGFLITSLLLREKGEFDKVHIGQFILRRIYRIWPLYFIIVIFAFFVAPHIGLLQVPIPSAISTWPNFAWSLGLYILFLPHIQALLIGPIIYCAQCWSIGIEEYFYFIWPFIIHKLRRRATIYLILIFTISYIGACILTIYLAKTTYADSQDFEKIYDLVLKVLKFDCLLIGALFAVLNSWLGARRNFLISKLFQVATLFTSLALTFKAYEFGGFYWEVHAILYGFIILNLVRSETSIFSFERKPFDYLGKISYGIYMYHPIMVVVAVKILCSRHYYFAVYPAAFAGTILLSALSYRYIERWFLRRKIAHSYIRTG